MERSLDDKMAAAERFYGRFAFGAVTCFHVCVSVCNACMYVCMYVCAFDKTRHAISFNEEKIETDRERQRKKEREREEEKRKEEREEGKVQIETERFAKSLFASLYLRVSTRDVTRRDATCEKVNESCAKSHPRLCLAIGQVANRLPDVLVISKYCHRLGCVICTLDIRREHKRAARTRTSPRARQYRGER